MKIGRILLRLGAKIDKVIFQDTVKQTFLGMAQPWMLWNQKTTIEIRDLNCLTEESKVEEAFRLHFPELGGGARLTSHWRMKEGRRLPLYGWVRRWLET